MPKRIKTQALILLLTLLSCMLLLIGCNVNAGQTDGAAQSPGTPISVNNDEVVAGETGATVTDTEAGKISRPPITSTPDPLESGSTAPPNAYDPSGDILAKATGAAPMIGHGNTNGDSCLTCHESGSGGAPKDPQSHKVGGVTNELCRNCHKDA